MTPPLSRCPQGASDRHGPRQGRGDSSPAPAERRGHVGAVAGPSWPHGATASRGLDGPQDAPGGPGPGAWAAPRTPRGGLDPAPVPARGRPRPDVLQRGPVSDAHGAPWVPAISGVTAPCSSPPAESATPRDTAAPEKVRRADTAAPGNAGLTPRGRPRQTQGAGAGATATGTGSLGPRDPSHRRRTDTPLTPGDARAATPKGALTTHARPAPPRPARAHSAVHGRFPRRLSRSRFVVRTACDTGSCEVRFPLPTSPEVLGESEVTRGFPTAPKARVVQGSTQSPR